MKFYFLHMNSDEVGTPLKNLATINGNDKNVRNFYFKNLTLRLITNKNPKLANLPSMEANPPSIPSILLLLHLQNSPSLSPTPNTRREWQKKQKIALFLATDWAKIKDTCPDFVTRFWMCQTHSKNVSQNQDTCFYVSDTYRTKNRVRYINTGHVHPFGRVLLLS